MYFRLLTLSFLSIYSLYGAAYESSEEFSKHKQKKALITGIMGQMALI